LKRVLNMNRLAAVTVAGAALSLGCAAATGSQSLPDEISLSRTSRAYADVAGMRSERDLETALPRLLARYGYFIVDSRPTAGGVRLLTDWVVRPLEREEAFGGALRARTRLVLDARRRGDVYAVTIYAVRFLEDASGVWRDAGASEAMRKHVQDIGTQMAAKM
jgi:hypothetical protein